MNIQKIIDIGNELAVEINADVQNKIEQAFQKIGRLFGHVEQQEYWNQPLRLIDCEQEQETPANFDNKITPKIVSFQNLNQRETHEIMQRIKRIKNARVRKDGRYDWRKMIAGQTYYIIESNLELFEKKVRQMQKDIKANINRGHTVPQKLPLYELAKRYYERVILGQVKNKAIKPSSAKLYENALKYLLPLKRPIREYTKDDITDFFNQIQHHRIGAYCYFFLKRVFADEFEKGNLKHNPIATMKMPFSQKRCGTKGSWLNIQEQQLLKTHLDNSIFSKEILFYLFTGCRLKEAYDAKIDFTKNQVYITRHKTEFSGVKSTIIPLSPKFCDLIKKDWPEMFKIRPDNLTKKISDFLKRIGIQNKSTHDLRHTFSTNLYYLGVDPKRQQYLMGHTNIQQTYDTYTTLDITITKEDVYNIWGDLYPEF